MKKILFSIILASFLNVGLTKPACSGFMIDFAAIAQNIGGNTQVIYDTITQGIQQANMIKQATTQGVNLNSWKFPIGPGGLPDIGGMRGPGGLSMNGKVQTLKPKVESTKGKNTELLTQERDLYAEAAKAEKRMKVEIAEQNIAKDEAKLADVQREKNTKVTEADIAYRRYENLRGTGTPEEDEALDDYYTKVSQRDKLFSDEAELIKSIEEQKIILVKLQKEAEEAGTPADKKWIDMNQRVKILTEEEKDTEIMIDSPVDENTKWEKMQDLNIFNVDQSTYKKFIESYFYEQKEDAFTDLGKDRALREARQEHQAKGDKLERQRKYLVVNTAAHLLQVSASIRRDLPIHESTAQDWFEETKKADSELEAIAAYSNTRIENARALILYARLQAAKMQYLAAREIKSSSLKKQGKVEDNDFSEFDLEKYILTQEYIKELIENSNKTGVISSMENADIGN